MKNSVILGILCFVVTVTSIHGQIVLEPQVAGTVEHRLFRFVAPYYANSFTSQHTNVMPGQWSVGMYYNYVITPSSHYTHSYYIRDNRCRAVVEFDINQTAAGDPFPTENMTESNWVAHLNDLQVTFADEEGYDLEVRVHDMAGDDQNGILTQQDYFAAIDPPFHSLFEEIPGVGTVYSGIDITEQLRDDLFGMGIPSNTSGFILAMNYEYYPMYSLDVSIRFDPNPANITVEVFTPVPTNTPVNTPTPPLPCRYDGDLNNDGLLTPDDSLITFQIFLLMIPDPTVEELCSADCNHDETVTPGDAQCVFSHYMTGECDCEEGIE